MKAIRLNQHGGPEVLKLQELPEPEAGPGQMLVKVAAAGVNFVETYQRTGAYQVDLPKTMGSEGAGEVVAVGGVSGFSPGDRIAFTGSTGSYAEMTLVPERSAVRLADAVSLETAAALYLQGMTAHFLCNSTYPVQEGDWCLVHAAAGGVGLLLTQMIKMRGGNVIATVSTEAKAELARNAGADEVVLYTKQDFVGEVKRITDGALLPVVYDSVGKTTFNGSLDCLRPRGYMVLFGQASGRVDPVDPQLLNAKGSLFLTRPTMTSYVATREEHEWRADDIFGWAASGALDVHVGLSLPLGQAGEAPVRLESRETTGKVLLIP